MILKGYPLDVMAYLSACVLQLNDIHHTQWHTAGAAPLGGARIARLDHKTTYGV